MQTTPVDKSTFRLITAGILSLCSFQPQAAGFALIEQGASGMGNAFAGGSAIAEDASTVFFNPAGMNRLSSEFLAAGHAIKTKAKFDGSATGIFGGPVGGGNGGNGGAVGHVPNLYLVTPLSDAVTFGLGINVPFGLATKYDADWKGRYHAIESEISTVNVNPSLAVTFGDKLSVGFGVSVQYVEATLTSAIDQGSLCGAQPILTGAPDVPTAIANCAAAGLVATNGNGTSDAFTEIHGDDWSFGFNFGFLYEPSVATRIGLAYRSQIKQELSGEAKFSNAHPIFTGVNNFVETHIDADIDLPQTISLSTYHDVNDKFAVMADATWTGWKSFDELRVRYDSAQPDTLVDEDWNNSMRYAFGINIKPISSLVVRAGVAWDESPIPNNEFRTPRVPGEDRTWVSMGIGYQVTKTIGIDVGYSHLFVQNPKVNKTETTAGNVSGSYDAEVDIVSAQVVWDM